MTEATLGAIIVAVLTVIGNVLVSSSANNKIKALIEYRVGELEKKQDKHNNMIERVFILEGQMQEVQHDIRDLKKGA